MTKIQEMVDVLERFRRGVMRKCMGMPGSTDIVLLLTILEDTAQSLAIEEEKEKAVEPLAVLADRKGCSLVYRRHNEDTVGMSVFGESGNAARLGQIRFDFHTYAEAEAKAREFLNELPDKEKK